MTDSCLAIPLTVAAIKRDPSVARCTVFMVFARSVTIILLFLSTCVGLQVGTYLQLIHLFHMFLLLQP